MVNAVKVFTLRLCISAYYIHFKRVKVKIFTAFTIVVCIGYVFDVAPSFRQAIQTFAFIIKRQRTRGLEKFFNGIGLKPRDYIIISIGALIVLIASIFQ